MILSKQPQYHAQIDWSNQITKGLAFAFVNGTSARGISKSAPVVAYSGGTRIANNQGTAAKATSSSAQIYTTGATNLTTTTYSLLAVATGTSAAVQSAIDDDTTVGPVRKFQFRIDTGKVELIPFDVSAGVTGRATSSVALTAAQLAGGFVMGATASPTATAVFQNGVKTGSATPTNMAAPTGDFWIGAQKTGTQGWTVGGLNLVVGWFRTLSDAEMRSLGDNPWQIFLAPTRRKFAPPAAAGGSFQAAWAVNSNVLIQPQVN